MPVLLITTVGGAPEPVAGGILHLRPARVLFVCSPETKSMIDLPNPPEGRSPGILQILQAHGHHLTRDEFGILDAGDAQDLEAIVKAIRHEAAALVQDWLARGDGREIVVDFTGGTKCMSAAMVLVARRWPCRLQYVGGTARTKDGVGVVVSGREQFLHQRNPWHTLAYETVERAVTLFDSGSPAAALKEVEAALPATSGAPKSGLSALRALCACYAAWDRFDHRQAAREAEGFLKSPYTLCAFWSTAAVRHLEFTVNGHLRHLSSLAQAQGATIELVFDLQHNAGRRMREGRYDDAVARYYRLIEAYGQWRLSLLGFPSTSEIPLAAIPETLQQLWAHDAQNGSLKLPLQRTYQLLNVLGDRAAAHFSGAGLDDPKRSPLMLRNQSVLAHGFQPVSDRAASALQEVVARLLSGEQPRDSLRFPVLREVADL